MYIQNIYTYASLCINLNLALHDRQSANIEQIRSRDVNTLFLGVEVRLGKLGGHTTLLMNT